MLATHSPARPDDTRVLGGAFGAIAKEMAQVIFRTAFFQIIREAEDLGAGLYTADGQEIAESETTAMHCGSIGAYLRGIRSVWGDDIARRRRLPPQRSPLHGASHMADVCIAIPVFWDDELLAWAADTAHLADLGSASAGLCTDAFDYFAEGRNYRRAEDRARGRAQRGADPSHLRERAHARTSTAATSRRSTPPRSWARGAFEACSRGTAPTW